ncbi:hypothetical protein C1645_817428 [Glomus cerebriforme]|uniref:TRP C-terminal domain-containing protein n=1 Tax=Glomus cerebriforme TaxID=658196 RepID=A0A397T9C6_9GLOM|nr:hypothetical protein C1645_817428 [Glomus cerebriforme]
MTDVFLNLRRISLCFYAIILLSLYVVQVLTNPVVSPPPTLQKRQGGVITITSTTTFTEFPNVITNTKAGSPAKETFPLSKPKNCVGPVKFLKVEVITSRVANTFSFIAKGKTSLPIDTAMVKSSIYWDNKRSAENESSCPSELCEISGDRPTIIFNYTTSLSNEFLDNVLHSGPNAYLSLSVIGIDGKVLGCVTTSFNGIITDAIPYFFNIPILCGTVSIICIAVVKNRKIDENHCHNGHDDEGHDEHGGHEKHDRHDKYGKHEKHGECDEHERHGKHPNSQGTDPSGNHQSPQPHSTTHTNSSGNVQQTSQDIPYLDPSGNVPTAAQSTPYDPSGNESIPTAPSHDPIGGIPINPNEKPITQQPHSSNQAPSIYDIIRAAQFFVTTALISLPGLPYGYQDVVSKIGWSMGFPSNLSIFNISFLSNVADEQIISFCCTIGVALVIALLIWLFAWSCKRWRSTWFNKWSFLKTAVENVHFLMLGGILRVLILFYYPITLFAIYQLALTKDCWILIFLAVISIAFLSLGIMIFCGYKILQPLKRNELEEYKKPSYTLLYGSLYSQYIENSSFKSTRIWFFIFPIIYDFLRALVIGLGQRSAIVQIIDRYNGFAICDCDIINTILGQYTSYLSNYNRICYEVIAVHYHYIVSHFFNRYFNCCNTKFHERKQERQGR